MKEMILLTKEEYNGLLAEIGMRGAAKESEEWQKNNALRWLDKAIARAEHLWDELNRPAIEAAAQKHEDEFLDWCADKAFEYDKKDFDEWVADRSKFYNNGHATFCKAHHIDWDDYELYAKYDGWHPVVTEEKTEGWTDLHGMSVNGIEVCDINRRNYTWILPAARADVHARYNEHKSQTGLCEGKYWDLWIGYEAMVAEVGIVEFYA